MSFNGTEQMEILAESDQAAAGGSSSSSSSSGGGAGGGGEGSSAKQREALYYIVAVITFYALTFMVLFCKYARFKKKELDDTVPYFPLPPDAAKATTPRGGKGGGAGAGAGEEGEGGGGDHMALRKYGPRDGRSSYGTSDVTPKVMRVKMVPHWLGCRREATKACDV